MERTTESVIYLDTHIVCWLYEGRVDLLSPSAAEAIDAGQLIISPMTVLELHYLYEIGRILVEPEVILSALAEEIGLQISEFPLAAIVQEARQLSWTRDPFDRLIAAEVMLLPNARLVTRNRTIRAHCLQALW